MENKNTVRIIVPDEFETPDAFIIRVAKHAEGQISAEYLMSEAFETREKFRDLLQLKFAREAQEKLGMSAGLICKYAYMDVIDKATGRRSKRRKELREAAKAKAKAKTKVEGDPDPDFKHKKGEVFNLGDENIIEQLNDKRSREYDVETMNNRDIGTRTDALRKGVPADELQILMMTSPELAEELKISVSRASSMRRRVSAEREESAYDTKKTRDTHGGALNSEMEHPYHK